MNSDEFSVVANMVKLEANNSGGKLRERRNTMVSTNDKPLEPRPYFPDLTM